MEISNLKQELIQLLEGIDKEQMDLCSLKEYTEIVKKVSEIKEYDPMETITNMMAGNAIGGSMSLGFGGHPRTIRELKEGRRREDDE